ncbi:MAG: DNA-binding transcriptional LysR family regulator [Cyclobacteriaceae bacterium]|jgi:DNA-binding transcriptional LysR family regulator
MITIRHQSTLRQYQYFLMVAEELSFRKAAEKLHIAQPGLSRQIQQLESELQVALFSRANRKVTLTPAGIFLRKELTAVFHQFNRINDQTLLIHEGKKGELKIGYVGSAMHSELPNLLGKLKEKEPLIDISLLELSNQQQLDWLLTDQIDLGFVRLQHTPPEIHQKIVLKDEFVIVLPSNHALNTVNFKNISQLKDEPFILFSSDYSPMYYDKIIGICEREGFSPHIKYKSVQAYTIFKLVEQGLGVSIIPSKLQTGYDLSVKFLRIPDIPEVTSLSVVWKKDSTNPVLDHVIPLI